MEILELNVIPTLGNAVEVLWGLYPGDFPNTTYALYYGSDPQEAFAVPQLTTNMSYAIVKNLSYCEKYWFALAVMEDAVRVNPNSSNIRSIMTFNNERLPPQNLTADFLPREQPCLLIKWSAACSNVARPLGYKLFTYDRDIYLPVAIIRIPPTRQPTVAHTVAVPYGNILDIKVIADVKGANSTDFLTYKVPYFLQPFNLRLSTEEEGVFILYWKEPFVPEDYGPYNYEVAIFSGKYANLNDPHETHVANRSVFTYKGNLTEYTFGVSLLAFHMGVKSPMSDLVYGNIFGEVIYQ